MVHRHHRSCMYFSFGFTMSLKKLGKMNNNPKCIKSKVLSELVGTACSTLGGEHNSMSG